VLSLLIGVVAQPMLDVAQTAANQAIDRAAYVKAVNPELTEQDLRIAPPDLHLSNTPHPAQVAGR
jgi:multicomponent Na+:H+ antiporter subunit D